MIDASVNLTGTGIREGGSLLKLLQTGNTGFYLLMMVIGSVLLLLLGML
jgi:NADH-quinone oxidoreductase subunit L